MAETCGTFDAMFTLAVIVFAWIGFSTTISSIVLFLVLALWNRPRIGTGERKEESSGK